MGKGSRMAGSNRSFQAIVTVDLVFQVFLWGLPGFLASAVLANLWNVILPKDVVFVRVLGAFSLAWAYLFYETLRDPLKNTGIIRGAVGSHFLVAAAILYNIFSQGVTGILSSSARSNLFWWVTALMNVVFACSILLSAPRATAESAAAG
jgi:hypothetical protein